MTLGQEIKAYRTAHGLSQAAFSDMVDVTVGAVCRWEAGDRSPRGNVLRRVRAVLEGHVPPERAYTAPPEGQADMLVMWLELSRAQRYQAMAFLAKMLEGEQTPDVAETSAVAKKRSKKR